MYPYVMMIFAAIIGAKNPLKTLKGFIINHFTGGLDWNISYQDNTENTLRTYFFDLPHDIAVFVIFYSSFVEMGFSWSLYMLYIPILSYYSVYRTQFRFCSFMNSYFKDEAGMHIPPAISKNPSLRRKIICCLFLPFIITITIVYYWSFRFFHLD